MIIIPGERPCLFLRCKEVNSLLQRAKWHRNNSCLLKHISFDASRAVRFEAQNSHQILLHYPRIQWFNLCRLWLLPFPRAQMTRREVLRHPSPSRVGHSNLVSVLPVLLAPSLSQAPMSNVPVFRFSLWPVFCIPQRANPWVAGFLVCLLVRKTTDLHLLGKTNVTAYQAFIHTSL